MELQKYPIPDPKKPIKYTKGFKICHTTAHLFKNFDIWKTERSYGGAYETLQNASGIYALVFRSDYWKRFPQIYQQEILYIGKSKNLKERLQKHNLLSRLNAMYSEEGDVIPYFIKMPVEDISQAEKILINVINPPYNLAYRTRGIR